VSDTTQPEPDISHDDSIGIAYVAGLVAARNGVPDPTNRNPYFRHTEEWDAYHSGWRDEWLRRRSPTVG
jgi:hypothetical protein